MKMESIYSNNRANGQRYMCSTCGIGKAVKDLLPQISDVLFSAGDF